MKYRSILAILFLVLLALAGCDDEGSISQPGSGGDDGGGGDDDTEVDVRIGNGSGNNFQGGALSLGIETISSGGSTGVSGTLVDSSGSLVNESYDVEFTSTCVENDQATINTPRSSIDGEFQTTYSASGCSGSDTIEATVALSEEETITATASVQIEPADLGSISFLSADPQNIGLRGMGGAGRTETSLVSFQVRDVTGAGIQGRDVNFSLSTAVGGIELTSDSATSDEEGNVSTTIVAGTVPTPVRVNAEVANTGISTQSELVTISTGIPEDNGVSLSADCWNVEALDEDGVDITLTMRLRDRFSNPVPDGTQVQFSSEGGLVESSCVTEDSACTVTWTSQNPRPGDGRSSLLAYLIGEESFVDMNGDGVYGQPEVTSGTLLDTGEPYRDDNESGDFNPGTDGFFFDFDQSGDRTDPNGVFDGALCGVNENDAFRQGNCGESQAPIGAQGLIIMSGSEAYIEVTDQNGNNLYNAANQPFDVSANGAAIDVRVFDINDNPMACGTEVAIDIDVGSAEDPTTQPVGGGYAIGGHSVPFYFSSSDPDTQETGRLRIEVTTPSGTTSIFPPISAVDNP